jgi:hypothetical protein
MALLTVWPTDAGDGSVANEARWRKMARLWVPSGVCVAVGGEMAPTLAGLNMTVKSGACYIDGHYAELAADTILPVTANGIAVVRFDPVANTAELLWRSGTGLTPTQNQNGVWEQPIAAVVASAIADRRGALVGPRASQLVHAPVLAAIPDGNYAGPVTVDVLFAGEIVPFNYPVTAQAFVTMTWGFSGVANIRASLNLFALSSGSLLTGSGEHMAGAGGFGGLNCTFALVTQWIIPAGQDPRVKLQFVATTAANYHTGGFVIVNYYG